jgi:exopolysaccharide biosynthesis polyprenyl glycosylphosphotransferase
MQLDAKSTGAEPSPLSTVPRLYAATPPSRRMELVRGDFWYSTLTVLFDVLSAAGAVGLALWWIPGPTAHHAAGRYAWAFVPIVVIVLATRGLYKRKLKRSFLDDFEPVETAVAVSALATLTVFLVAIPTLQAGDVVVAHVRTSEMLVRLWVCAAILMPAVRLIKSVAQRYLRRKYLPGSPTLIVGSGQIAHQLITRMRQVPEYGLRPVGVLDDVRPTDAELLDVPYLGTTDNLENAARTTRAEELIVAPSTVPDELLARTAQRAQSLGIRVRVVPRLVDVVGVGARVEHLGGVPLLVLNHVHPKGWQFAVKHALGRLIAGVGLLLISPLFLALALLVRFSSPGPILFRQRRIGRDGRVFDCLKFRTMRPPDPANAAFALKTGAAPGGVEGDDRRTPIGKFMRKASLDELPQLLNVLRGDMALVGPRPERPDFVELFEMNVRRYGERHRVKAGITGWAQVHGLRGQTSIADRAEFDNFYIENWSLGLDLKILLLTGLAVLRPSEE